MGIKKQALLIGALGGLGSATIKQLSARGWHLFAADLQQDVILRPGGPNRPPAPPQVISIP